MMTMRPLSFVGDIGWLVSHHISVRDGELQEISRFLSLEQLIGRQYQLLGLKDYPIPLLGALATLPHSLHMRLGILPTPWHDTFRSSILHMCKPQRQKNLDAEHFRGNYGRRRQIPAIAPSIVVTFVVPPSVVRYLPHPTPYFFSYFFGSTPSPPPPINFHLASFLSSPSLTFPQPLHRVTTTTMTFLNPLSPLRSKEGQGTFEGLYCPL
ncbi:hypothetical protein L6452_36538 [Arctium lappa]|uniref:Uncharacterized protein n=1 Tax=Arctium lappa TaxID=4217 RepID=A0ACB8YA31_ARCLA|nr:hypothetical protein L6452_36538 [Arctium lappa]